MNKFYFRRVAAFTIDFFITFYGAYFALVGVSQYSSFAINSASPVYVYTIGGMMFFLWIAVYLVYIPLAVKRFKGATFGNWIFGIGTHYKRKSFAWRFYRECILKYAFATSMTSIAMQLMRNFTDSAEGAPVPMVWSMLIAVLFVSFLLWLWPGEPTHNRNILDRFSASYAYDMKDDNVVKKAKANTTLRHKKQRQRVAKNS